MCIRDRGRILRTYCHEEHKDWSKYVEAAETFLNLAYHETIGASPYQVMFNRPPPREIISLIEFPFIEEKELSIIEIHNRVLHKAELQKKKQERDNNRILKYYMGEKVLLKNRHLPSYVEGITKKLLLLYTGPYKITKDNNNNTYELTNTETNKVKGVYNQAEIKNIMEIEKSNCEVNQLI